MDKELIEGTGFTTENTQAPSGPVRPMDEPPGGGDGPSAGGKGIPARVKRNRSNARKSTGPKTARGKRFSSLNSTKLGLTAGAGRHLMEMLGEDPAECEALGDGLREEWQPATETARHLVEQLAELFWKQRRLARAEQALAARQVDELLQERSALAAQIGRARLSVSERGLHLKGLCGEPDSPGKFEDLISNLTALAEEAEARRASGPWSALADLIWGEAPTVNGLAIRSLFHKMAEAAKATGVPALNEEEFQTLRNSLHEEIDSARRSYLSYRERHVEITPALRESYWAPVRPEWMLLIRQRNSIFRQIDRTLRLLVEFRGSAASPQPAARQARPDTSGFGPHSVRAHAMRPPSAGLGPAQSFPRGRESVAGSVGHPHGEDEVNIANPSAQKAARNNKNCKTKPKGLLESSRVTMNCSGGLRPAAMVLLEPARPSSPLEEARCISRDFND